jgi:uncharacterized protein YceK
MRLLKLIVITLFIVIIGGCTSVKKVDAVSKSENIEEIYKIVALARSNVGNNDIPCSDAVGI